MAGWRSHDLIRAGPNRHPNDWIRASEEALDALKASHGKMLAAVKGIGLSGQMHGATLLDRADQVLRALHIVE